MAEQKKQPKNDEWRQFEKLVTRIERAFAPNAKIKHNDRIWDYESEGYRQVDVSIRCQIGLHNVLITLECRKRGRKSDVNWIEELAEKRVGIRADKTIAVSSKPLTAPAVRKAKKKNIDVRLISEISKRDIHAWTTLTEMDYEERTIEFLWVEACVLDDDEGNTIHAEVIEAIGKDGSRAKIFVEQDKVFSPRDFINSWSAAFNEKGGVADLFFGVQRNGNPVRKAIRHEFKFPTIQVRTQLGMVAVHRVGLLFANHDTTLL